MSIVCMEYNLDTSMEKVSCVMCAYNEEGRIGNVLQAIGGHPLLDEVIVIDDGSKDKTRELVQAYKNIRLITYEINKGKSYALATGIAAAKNDILMLIDADLIGLTPEDITRLVEPVLSNATDISMTLRKNSLFIYRWIGLDFISGERVLKKNLLDDRLEEIKQLPGYGVEVYMNRLIIERKLRVKIVRWPDVSVTLKMAKVGFWKGLGGEAGMIRQILKVITLREVIHQNYALLVLARTRF